MNLTVFKRLLATALLGLVAANGARADASANGAALYANQCAGCHGSSPLTSNTSKIYNGRNARNVIDSAISGDTGGMSFLRSAFPAGGTELADVAAYLGNTPANLTFGSTAVGSTASAQTITVYASLKTGNSLSGMSLATTGDFTRSGGTCATTLGTGLSCTVLVTFTPTAAGARSGTLSLTHNNTLTPIVTALSGTGTGTSAPVANITPAALTLAATAIGSTSAAQNVNVANTGNAALAITAITLSNSADFIVAGGTCSAGGSVAAGSSCTVSVAFKPSGGTAGSRSGSLNIGHNATGSPGSVSLSGSATAAAAPAAALTASLAFGSVNVGTTSTAQTATLSNTGTAALVLGLLTTGSTEFAISGGTCVAGGSLAAAGSCSINLAFTPSAAGARSASLVVTHNASGGQSSASLSGTGVALSPVIGVSPTTLSFNQTVGSSSVAQTVTVSNSGNAALSISAVALAGAQAAEYQIASGSTCAAGGSVAANASCVLKLVFTPTAASARNASLAITHNAVGSPSSVTLNGTGTTAPQAAISLNAATLTFPAQTVGSSSAVQSVTVSNSGTAALNFTGLTLAGTSAGDFSRSGTCTPTATLAAGASCSVSFSFAPGAVGARSATLTLASNASNGSAVLGLAGTGTAVAIPGVSLAPGSLAFGNQTTGVASTARTVTLSNTGSGALSISSITATSGFGISHGCGASLAAGASCALSVTFTPAVAGAASGSVSVASNAIGSPHAVSLSGTGVAACPVLAWVPTVTSVAFGDVTLGANPASRSLTLSNQGPGTITLQQLTLAGAQAADFSLGSGTCAVNAALAQGASCTVALAFQPGAVGPRTATLQVVSNGTNPPDVALTGNGTAVAQPAAAVVPTALGFSAAAGASADAQTLNLQSTGNAVLHVTTMRVASGAFTLASNAANGCAATPFDLMPGQSCALSIGWSSAAIGSETGAVEIDTNAAVTAIQVPITALRDAAAPPPTTPPPTPPATANAGAGGCSIARGDTLADPMLWLLLLLAGAVLWHRRATR
jgi:mono/diheme cytochrome c family protein